MKCYVWLHSKENLLLFQPESFGEILKKISLWKNKTWDATSVLYDKGVVWVSTIGHGILRYYVSSGYIDRITYKENNKENSLSIQMFFKLFQLIIIVILQ